MAWFNDPHIHTRFPAAFRLYAAYARAVGDPRTSAVRGGTSLQRALAWMTRRCHWQDVGRIDTPGVTLAVDLLDCRLPEVLAEIAEPHREIEILRACLAPGGTFLDIGANHGTYAVQLACAMGATGRVVAFEPQPRLAALIRRSFQENGIFGGEVIEGACGDAARTVALHVPVNSGMASLYRASVSEAHVSTITVRQHRLDDVMAGRSVGGAVAIKLDAEGAEVGVLEGGRAFLRAHRPPMVIELNGDCLEAAGYTSSALVAALAGAGYTAFSEVDTWPAARPLAELAPDRRRNVVVHAAGESVRP